MVNARSKTTTLTRTELAEMFEKGIIRKNAEQNLFGMRALDKPERQAIYSDLYDFLDLEIRYYHVAARYYRDEIDSLDDRGFDDLLLLTSVDLSPRMYVIYLREIDQADRGDEKITREALKALKTAIRKAMGKE